MKQQAIQSAAPRMPQFGQKPNQPVKMTGFSRADVQHAREVHPRELNLRISLLVAMLALPKDHPLATRDPKERSAMGVRLALYRREKLRRRQRNEQLRTDERLTHSLSQMKSRFH